MTRGFIYLELKVASDDAGRFTGKASTYGNRDASGDVVQAGAFTESLRKRGNTRPLLMGHDANEILGLGIFTDTAAALEVSGQLNLDVARAKEAYSLLKQGALTGLSIGFVFPGPNSYSIDGNGGRTLKEIDLLETSLTPFPMNPAAQITSVKSSIASLRDFEKFLHAQGFSKTEAARLASGGWKDYQPDTAESLLLEGLRALNGTA